MLRRFVKYPFDPLICGFKVLHYVDVVILRLRYEFVSKILLIVSKSSIIAQGQYMTNCLILKKIQIRNRVMACNIKLIVQDFTKMDAIEALFLLFLRVLFIVFFLILNEDILDGLSVFKGDVIIH